jgi:hypothetical protein
LDKVNEDDKIYLNLNLKNIKNESIRLGKDRQELPIKDSS